MNIKFSHDYPKLWGQKAALLLAVRKIHFNEVSKELIEYDTKNSEGGYYKLPETDLIQLIFYGNHKIPFCTIRRYTPEKMTYYKSKVGEIFQVVVDGCSD